MCNDNVEIYRFDSQLSGDFSKVGAVRRRIMRVLEVWVMGHSR